MKNISKKKTIFVLISISLMIGVFVYNIEKGKNYKYEIDSHEYKNVFTIEYPKEKKKVNKNNNKNTKTINNSQPTTTKVYISPVAFKYQGEIYYGGHRYTWYSEKVLPGGGLNIPGRHVNEDGYVCDEYGYVVVASCDYSQGTILDTPLGLQAKVYDICPISGTIDVYVSW